MTRPRMSHLVACEARHQWQCPCSLMHLQGREPFLLSNRKIDLLLILSRGPDSSVWWPSHTDLPCIGVKHWYIMIISLCHVVAGVIF